MKLSQAGSRQALALLSAAVAAAVYLNSLANGFALDDVMIVQANPRVHDVSALRDIWLTPYWPFLGRELGLYRPATIFLFALEWAAGDGAPWVFHAANAALHAAVTAFVFLLLDRLTAPAAAFAGALVFAVHPVHTEAVANVVGQAELAGALAVLGACLVHITRSGVAVSWPRRLALVLLYGAALAFKESTVVLPALLVLTDLAQKKVELTVRGAAAYADAMLMPLILLAATLCGYLLLRFDVLGGAITGLDAAPAMPYLREEHRVLNALRAFPELIRLMVLPIELAADYLPGILLPVEQVRPMVVLGALLLAGLALLGLLTPWRPAAGFPAAWFLISIVTVSNLFFPIGVLVAERTLYLPSVAFAAFIAYAGVAVDRHGSLAARRAGIAVLGLVVLGFSVRTWIRNPDWRDTAAMLNAFVRDHPQSYRAQWSLAGLYRAQGDMARADWHYRLAFEIYDRDAEFLNEYADFLMLQSRIGEAMEMLERSNATRPGRPQTLVPLAHAYLVAGRYADAIDLMRDAEQAGVHRATASLVCAAAHAGLGDHERAATAWRVGIRHTDRPTWRMYGFLARALAAAGYAEQARIALDTASAIASDESARSALDRIRGAIASECYVAAENAAAVTACDTLGRWIGFVPTSGGVQ